MSHQNTPRPNKRQPRTLNRSNPPTPEGTFNLRNPSPNTNVLRPQVYYHPPYPNQQYRNPAPASEQHGFHIYGSQPNAFQEYASQSPMFHNQEYVSETQMGGSSQSRMDPPRSPINALNLTDCYLPQMSPPFNENTGYWQEHNPYETQNEEAPVEHVATSPKKKKKASRNRQKRVVETEDSVNKRQIPWTRDEEIILCKGWLSISEDSYRGNTKKASGLWVEILNYMESKTKQVGRRTYDSVNGKWKTVRPACIRFCGIYNNIIRMGPVSGAGDADYIERALKHYEIETGVPFKLLHCWEILKNHPKWQKIPVPDFETESQGGSKRQKSTGTSSFNTESGDASINLNINTGNDNEDEDEDEVQETQQQPRGRDKAKATGRKRGSKSSVSGSSNVNEDALAKLMVNELATLEKEERLAFLDIKRREVLCREAEIEQHDMQLYLQPFEHLTGDQRKAMDAVRARIKAKYNLEF